MKHTPLTEDLYDYLLQVSLREHPVLRELREKTASMPLAMMQTEPAQAQFLQLLIRLIGAKKVVELGTFTGYSALAMALALPDDGQLVTCDINPEWTANAPDFWTRAGCDHKITLRLGKAADTVDALLQEGWAGQTDFIFIDADKTLYRHYYEQALALVSPNGLIAIDNVFWDGNVVNPDDTGAQVREIRRLNTFIQQDDRVDVSLLPIADGLFLVKPRNR